MVCLFRSIAGELVYISELFPVVVSVPGLFTAFDEWIGEVAGAAFAVIFHFSAMAAFVFVIHDGFTSFLIGTPFLHSCGCALGCNRQSRATGGQGSVRDITGGNV